MPTGKERVFRAGSAKRCPGRKAFLPSVLPLARPAAPQDKKTIVGQAIVDLGGMVEKMTPWPSWFWERIELKKPVKGNPVKMTSQEVAFTGNFKIHRSTELSSQAEKLKHVSNLPFPHRIFASKLV